MKYLIAHTVVYDTESGELTIPGAEAPEGKKLTNTANRILSLLIATPGVVLERQYLLEQVWESAGHTSSSSSLNQYVSILRKTLTSLTDIEETIIVVPKVGFFFSSDIDVQIIDTTEGVTELENISPRRVRKKRFPQRYIWATVGIVVLLVANIWVWRKEQPNQRYDELTMIGHLGKCSVNTFEHLSGDMRKHLIDVLLSAQPSLKEKCALHAAQLMVNIQPNVFYGSRGRIFYAFCPLDSENNTLIYCENHYAFNWEMK
ncbi:winged helix-turn-helix domain-containing protein [Enterobacter ludwigii]